MLIFSIPYQSTWWFSVSFHLLQEQQAWPLGQWQKQHTCGSPSYCSRLVAWWTLRRGPLLSSPGCGCDVGAGWRINPGMMGIINLFIQVIWKKKPTIMRNVGVCVCFFFRLKRFWMKLTWHVDNWASGIIHRLYRLFFNSIFPPDRDGILKSQPLDFIVMNDTIIFSEITIFLRIPLTRKLPKLKKLIIQISLFRFVTL